MQYNPIQIGDGKTRYALVQEGKRTLFIIGLNPSTADDMETDQTMQSVLRIIEYNGYDGFVMLNLYPFREPKSEEIPQEFDINLHNRNLKEIAKLLQERKTVDVWLAYGAASKVKAATRKYLFSHYINDIVDIFNQHSVHWYYINEPTSGGYPPHPLYQKAESKLKACDIEPDGKIINCADKNTSKLQKQDIQCFESCTTFPDPNTVHPIAGYENEIYVKPMVKNPAIVVGDFTYIADYDFDRHVTHLYEWNGDKLIIGKFCQIASGVEFVMNGANHQMNAVTTFPFYTLEGWNMQPPAREDLPLKGDTVIGNDVWIGQNATILPGVHIGDGAIIGANCVVGSDVAPYTIVVGNPARVVRKRFDNELIDLLERFKWWDKTIEEIDLLIPILTSSNLEMIREEIKKKLREVV